MQETFKKVVGETAESIAKLVILGIRSQKIILNGVWNWDMNSSAVYCSDVMSFPDEFVGTKGIVHPDDLSKLMAALSLIEDKEISRLDFRIITTYGEVKTITGQRISVQTPKNENTTDLIPGKERWEETLHHLALQKEADFLQLRKTLSDHSERLHNTGSWLINKTTSEAWYSDNVYRIYRLAPQSLNAHINTFNPFIHPDDLPAVQEAFEKAYEEELSLHIEYRILLPAGETKYVQQITKWVYSHKGHFVFAGILRDITEERTIADELLAAQSATLLSQQLLKLSEQQWLTGHWHINLVTRKASFSENYHRIYGVKLNTIPNNYSFITLVHPEDRNRVGDAMDKMYSEHSLPEMEFRIVRPDGKVKLLRQSGRLFITPNKETMMIGVVQDITLLKGLKEKIAELSTTISLNRSIAEMMETAGNISYITWLQNGYMQWSDGFYQLLGYCPGSVDPISRILYKNIYSEDLAAFRAAEASVMNGQLHDDLLVRIVSKQGLQLVRFSFRQINTEKEGTTTIGLAHDVTKQTAIQQELSASKAFGELVINSVSNIIIFTNTDNVILHWNKEAEKATHIPQEEALQGNLFDVLPGLDEEDFLGQLHFALRGNETQPKRISGTYIRKIHDYWLCPLKNEQGEVLGILHLVKDISEQLLLQQQLNERLNFIESLVEASVDRIVVLDRFMNYLYWNKKAEDYYGIPKEKVLGKNILEVFPSFRNNPGYNEFRSVLKGETVFLPAVAGGETPEYTETWLTPIKNEEGSVTAILWIVHDLSREYQLTKERTEAASLLQATIDASKEMIQVFEAVRNEERNIVDFKWVLTNHEAENWMGNVIGESLLQHQPGVVEEGIFDTFKQVVETGIPHQSERYYVQEQFNGWFFQSTVKLNDGVATTTRDITQRKKAEQELFRLKDEVAQKATDKYISLFNSIDQGFCIVQIIFDNNNEAVDLRFLEVNPAFEKQTGLMGAAGKTMRELHPSHEPHWFSIYGEVAKTGKPVRFERKAENLLSGAWYEIYAYPFGEKENLQVAILFNNITERKKNEEALLLNKERLQLALSAAELGTFVWHIAEDRTEADARALAHFGLPADSNVTLKEALVTTFHPEDGPRYVAAVQSAADPSGPGALHIEFRIRHPHKGEQWMAVSAITAFEGTPPKATRMTGVLANITERKKIEEALQESEERFRSLVTATSDAVYKMSADWKLMHLLKGKDFLKHTSTTSNSWLETYIPEHEKERVIAAIKKAIQNKTIFELEHKVYNAKGGLSWVYSRAIPKLDKNGNIIEWLGAASNIRLRKEAEEKLKNFALMLQQQVDEKTKDILQKTEELQKNLTLLRYTEYLAQSGSWEYEIANGNFTWSEGMYKIFGVPRQMQVRPEIYLDSAIEEDRSIAKKIVSNLKKKHDPFEEVMRIKKGNEERTIKIKGSVINAGNGKAQKVIGVDFDITDIVKIEATLKESRHWLEQTSHASPDAITVYDIQQKQPLYLNNCLAEWTGKTSAELVSMGMEGRLKLIHEDDRLKLLYFNETIATSTNDDIQTIEYRIKGKDEEWIWLQNRSKVFQRDANGKITHILSILQDVTEEVSLKDELKKRTQYAEAIIDASIDRIAVYDKELRILAWNRRSEEVTGSKKEKVLGQKLFDVFPRIAQDEELLKAHFDALKGKHVALPAKKGVYTNGYYERFFIPLKNDKGEMYGIVSIMHDISEIITRNEELRDLNQSLEQKNAELAQKNEEITSFAFVASHDMKEPLRKIHTFSDWLMEQEANQLSPKGKSLVEKINSSVHRMEFLIEDVLVLTKIHSDTHKEDDVDLNWVLKHVTLEMEEKLRQTQAEIESDELPIIKGNINQIFYLFKNLISNAIKFQKPGNIPKVKITAEIVSSHENKSLKPYDEYAKVSFTDNGFGFDQRYDKKIFQVFQRLHGKHEFEGTGIGLAICKKILENHEGTITVESELGKGSSFHCYFPLR